MVGIFVSFKNSTPNVPIPHMALSVNLGQYVSSFLIYLTLLWSIY